MTTGRALSTATNRLIDTVATWSPDDVLRQLRTSLWPQHLSLIQRLIRLLWLPFWIWTDQPAPAYHDRPAPFMGTSSAARRFRTMLRATQWRQLFIRFATLVLRALTITILIGCAWSILALMGSTDVQRIWLLRSLGVALALAIVFAWWYRPTLRDTAVMLDRTFDLADRTATAYDFAAADPGVRTKSPNLAYLQVIESTNTLAMLERHSILRLRVPVREAVLAAGLGMILLALHLLNGTGTSIDALAESSVPAFVPASDRLMQRAPIPDDHALPELYKPTVGEVQERADLSASAEHDLLEIADALDDNPLTSSISDAIREGDYERAAEELKALAPSLSEMSPDLKDQMADELDAAADDMSGDHPGLRDATEAAADGLRSDPQEAKDSLDDLGDSIDVTGNQVADQQELAEQMREARESEQTGDVQDSAGSRPDSGNSNTEGESTESSTAGEGSDAAAGQQSDSSSESSQSSSSEQAGENEGAESSESEGGSSGSESSENPQSSDGGGPGASGEAEQSQDGSTSGAGSGSVDGESSQTDGSSAGTSEDAEAGGGTGTGGGEGEDTDNQSSTGAESRPGTGSGDSPDPNVGDGSGSGTVSDSDGGDTSTTSITLSQAPDATGQRTGGSSSSSTGSGAGVAAGSGSVEQGDVGSAGPDSNRVPPEYRPIVEDYFSDGP